MKALILAPHCDDGEMGCGGTIQVLLEKNHDVHYIAFSKPETERGTKIERETSAATKILGIPPENVRILDYPRRHMPTARQAILDQLIQIKIEEKPDVIFVPSRLDTHQDHTTICQESIRAFRNKTILGYEEPWNNPTFPTQYFVPLTKQQVKTKLKALQCYKSQMHRPTFNLKVVESIMRVRGAQIEQPYAEAFEAIKIINLL